MDQDQKYNFRKKWAQLTQRLGIWGWFGWGLMLAIAAVVGWELFTQLHALVLQKYDAYFSEYKISNLDFFITAQILISWLFSASIAVFIGFVLLAMLTTFTRLKMPFGSRIGKMARKVMFSGALAKSALAVILLAASVFVLLLNEDSFQSVAGNAIVYSFITALIVIFPLGLVMSVPVAYLSAVLLFWAGVKGLIAGAILGVSAFLISIAQSPHYLDQFLPAKWVRILPFDTGKLILLGLGFGLWLKLFYFVS